MKRRPFAALLVVNWRLKIAAKSLPNLLKWEGTVSQGITDTSTMVGLALLITLPLSGLAGTAQAQQVQQSPVAAVPTEESNYPSGTRLRSPTTSILYLSPTPASPIIQRLIYMYEMYVSEALFADSHKSLKYFL